MACRKVFLDLGANIGVNMRFLYEPLKYPRTQFMISEMERVLGQNRSDVCYYGFEANPNHYKRLESLRAHFADRRVGIWNRPVGILRENRTFYHNRKDTKKEEWGFSSKSHSKHSSPVQLTTLNFPAWFDTTVHANMTIMMKVDIEGGEYELLAALLARGSLCKVDTITMEWHSKLCDGVWCKLRSSLSTLLHTLPAVGCNVTVLNKDDESYLHDGVPL